MDDRRKDQAERIVKRYAHLIEMQAGKAVRPYGRNHENSKPWRVEALV